MVNNVALERIGNPNSLVKKIITQLSQAILEGDFKPGDKLPSEAVLCEKLGVGRNSLREAIRMLNAMGVMETKRGQGTFLRDTVSEDVFNPLIFQLILAPKQNSDVYELRVMIESIVVIMAIRKASKEEIAAIRRFVEETNRIFESKTADLEKLVDLDVQFHIGLAKCVHNSLIEAILEKLILIFRPSIKKVLKTEDGMRLCIKNHFAIVDIIERKSVVEVFDLVESTLSDTFNDDSKKKLDNTFFEIP